MMIESILYAIQKQPLGQQPENIICILPQSRIWESKSTKRHEDELGRVVSPQDTVSRKSLHRKSDSISAKNDKLAPDNV